MFKVESKADLASQDILLMSPLHWAASNKNVQESTLQQIFSKINDEILNSKDKFERTCMDIAREQENWPFLRSIASFRAIIPESNYMEICQSDLIKPRENSCKQKIRLAEIDSDDDSETNFCQGLESFKKKKISSSPIQNIEETLAWLQNQAIANTSDDFILEDKEFYLTGKIFNF